MSSYKTQAPLDLLWCQPHFSPEPGNALKAKCKVSQEWAKRYTKKKKKRTKMCFSTSVGSYESEWEQGGDTEQVLGTINPQKGLLCITLSIQWHWLNLNCYLCCLTSLKQPCDSSSILFPDAKGHWGRWSVAMLGFGIKQIFLETWVTDRFSLQGCR